ncbi:hypothetical protein [Streptomyces sp. NPDC090083]|uniref:hypothetical protein n=1 Tax=Streptomyces sp. NPDC090083 TaxID=3365941 RepID=UPI00382F5425
MSEAAKRTLRTVVQTTVGLCVLLPTVVDAAGVTRIMALPAVQALLPSWLRTDVPAAGDGALLEPVVAAPGREDA